MNQDKVMRPDGWPVGRFGWSPREGKGLETYNAIDFNVIKIEDGKVTVDESFVLNLNEIQHMRLVITGDPSTLKPGGS